MKTTFTIITVVLFASIILACSKKDTPTPTMIDLLTSKEWTYDTLLINPPTKFSDLDNGQKMAYCDTHNSYKGSSVHFSSSGQLIYKEEGSATIKTTWKLVNNNKDVEWVDDPDADHKDTLHLFSVQKEKFSYVQYTNGHYDATYIYK